MPIHRGIFVTGTDTNVGKTWVGQRLIRALIKRGIDVVPRKPIESGWTNNIEETDAWKLASAANITNKIDQVCSYRFKHAVSPVRAARLENQCVNLNDIKQQCLSNIQDNQFLHIEGAGGFYSPLAENALNADLAEALALPVLLVAEDRIGCINQILLTVEVAQARGLNITAIFLNNTTENSNKAMDNQEDIRELINVPVMTNIDNLADSIMEQLQ